MTTITRGASMLLSIGVLILLILSGALFSSNHSSTSSLYTGNHRVPSNESAIAPVVSEAVLLPQKIAAPFGPRNVSRPSRSHDKARVRRADWQDYDPFWINSLGDGLKLLDQLQTGRRTDSVFNRVTDLTGPKDLTQDEIQNGEGKGWRVVSRPDETPEGYDKVLDDLHIPNGATNQEQFASNSYPFRNCRHQRNEPTRAQYIVGINVPGKAITAISSFGPAYMLKKQYGDHKMPLPPDWQEQLPDVNRQSDVLWIFWKDAAEDEAKDLKYVFRHHIITGQTKAVMEEAAGAEPEELYAPWPGHTFRFGKFFTALLGTPHGRGVVYLLTQHASGLPGKGLESITVFTDEKTEEGDEEAYHLLFTLTD